MRSAWRNKQLLRSIEHKPQSLQGQFYYNLLSLRGFCFKWILTLQWDRKQSNRNSTWFYIHKVTVHTQMRLPGHCFAVAKVLWKVCFVGWLPCGGFQLISKEPTSPSSVTLKVRWKPGFLRLICFKLYSTFLISEPQTLRIKQPIQIDQRKSC